PKAIKLKV
ncbi:hypothetical protein FOXB_06876, partial [Fusarium oxysporum f. sp. conglutinans Fo5176]